MDLPLSEIRKYRKLFEGLPPAVIEERYAPFLVGRGEVITAGLIILEEVMRCYNKHLLTVSTGGVRHGMLIRSEEHTSELQSRGHLVCRLLLEKKNNLSYLRWRKERRNDNKQ